jgi:hypothetical protein
MKTAAAFLVLMVVCAGCSRQPDIPEAKCLVFTNHNNHSITTWVNDEPVQVCDEVYNGYNKPFWPTLRKGENTVHFTASRLPASETKVIAELAPGQANDGTTVVKIIAGSIFSPKDLIVWNVTEDTQTSPRWTVRSSKGYRPSLEQYEDVGPVDEEMRTQIAAFLERLRKALDQKDIASVGLQVSDIEFLMKEIGASVSVEEDVFGEEHYCFRVSSMSDLKVVSGRKTVMAYRPDGESVFFAGRSPDAPQESGKMYFCLSADALYFVQNNSKLEPLWVKDY